MTDMEQPSPELNARVDKFLCRATFHIVQFNNRQTLFSAYDNWSATWPLYATDEAQTALDDIAATRLVFAVASTSALKKIRDAHFDRLASAESSERRNQSLLLRDPDGHLLQFDVDQPSAIFR